MTMEKIDTIIYDIKEEYKKAISKFNKFNSAHEGYAVILEELDELWEIVKKKKEDRSVYEMCREATQIATMAIRFIIDLCE
jgi:archaellum component FlaC